MLIYLDAHQFGSSLACVLRKLPVSEQPGWVVTTRLSLGRAGHSQAEPGEEWVTARLNLGGGHSQGDVNLLWICTDIIYLCIMCVFSHVYM